jgi:hypothetical protein
MKLALSARVICDPRTICQSRWAHDTLHAIADQVLKQRRIESKRNERRRRRSARPQQ